MDGRAVLTRNSKVLCDAPAPGLHGGTVTLNAESGPAKLTVNGAAVLVGVDLAGAVVQGCQTPTASGTSRCTAVSGPPTDGFATKLFANGLPLLLSGAVVGVTLGSPAGALFTTSEQVKLFAE